MTHMERLHIATQGNSQVIDINDQVKAVIEHSGINAGLACIFTVGSTGAITTTEAEPGLLNHDLKAFYEKTRSARCFLQTRRNLARR